jgi:hypothetical protein
MRCQSCGMESAGRFCNACGKPLAGSSTLTVSLPWAIAGAASLGFLVLLVVLLAGREKATQASAATVPSSVNSPTPPDISNLTPRERFDRLYNRVMAAAENGDQATVTQFTPMAVMAYSQLDNIDADARFHLALLTLHTGDPAKVEALADTILQQNPGHLFAYMIRGAQARFTSDDVALKQAYADFLGRYEAETAAGRPEYADHKRSIDEFLAAARKVQGT